MGPATTGREMTREEMIVACCTDLAGKVRGKAFPARQFDVADVADGAGVDPAAVLDHQIDHGLVGRVRTRGAAVIGRTGR